ncbi:hypothetical protein [Massilia sp. 9096]|uniref:hypothetical protein n=1 Tax=Massilia sp. 9096 TaxID=1500894 RepID=UPI0012DFEAB4|nr:hypothetical protein [Massilia sp. 9096]
MENLDRSKFTEAVTAWWHAIQHGSSREANAKTRLLGKIVEAWRRQKIALEALGPLADDTDVKLRQAASVFLLQYLETREKAISILKDLYANDPTLVASSAGGILRMYAAGKLSWQVADLT